MRRMFVLAVLCLASAPAFVHAHAVGVDCTRYGDKYVVEVFYDDDTPAIKAAVKVVNEAGDAVVNGVTDEQGKWTFAVPAAGKYVVHADAGAGHRARKSITVAPAESPSQLPIEPPGDGPSRAEFTRIPWLGTFLGLAFLAIVGGAFGIIAVIRKSTRE